MKNNLSLSIIIILFLFSYSKSEKAYKLNTHFYFDPISESECDHTNFWTPFNQNTTCFRWVMINLNDTENDTSLQLVLDHNIVEDTYLKMNDQLKILKVKWKRYSGNLSVPSKDIWFKLNLFETEPTIEKKASPFYKIGELVMNSYYVNNGIVTNCYGYWLDQTYLLDPSYAYTFTEEGNSVLIKTSEKRGIRPVITMKKSELKNIIPDAVYIDELIENGKLYSYKYENVSHGGYIYKQLQGFTVSTDNIIFAANNGKNPDYCVMYSYGGQNYSTLEGVKYDTCGHANGLAYNSKTDRVLICGPIDYKEVYQYTPRKLEFEATYPMSQGYPHFSGISYNKDKDYYVELSGRKIAFTETNGTWNLLYAFNYPCLETLQDVTYYDGYIFLPLYDAGEKTIWQLYSFWGKRYGVIKVFDAHFGSDGKPTKDFGRLIARLAFKDHGEIEGISFMNGKAIFGFAYVSHDPDNVYHFVEVDYEKLKEYFIKQSKKKEKEIELKFLEK